MPREETPGAKAERERLARRAADEQELQRKSAKAARDKARYQARKAAGEHPRRPGRPTDVPSGQNEAAVVEYLRRHPDATNKDVAFHAIYGGGTTAWEGLHHKTRKNAGAEAARVIKRLQDKGVVKQSGWTGGGRPRYDITDQAPEADQEKIERWFGKPGDPKSKSKRGRGKYTFFGEKPVDRDQPKDKGGGGKGWTAGAAEGLTGKSSDDNGGDDNGGDDDKGIGFLKGW